MNSDKAREFFSSYYEGTIERGLKQAFERQLSTDALVQAEYKAFEKTMLELKAIATEVPDPEFDLHDRIMARLDLHLLEEKKKPAPLFGFRFRSATAMGAICLVLVGAALSIRNYGPNWISSIYAPSSKIADQLSVGMRDGHPVLTFRTADKKTVVVRDAKTGEALTTGNLDGRDYPSGQIMRFHLNYKSEVATLLKVDVQGNKDTVYVALPGSKRDDRRVGSGTLNDLAIALSNYYQVTVVVAAPATDSMQWDFSKQSDPITAAASVLQGTQRSVDLRAQKIVWIQ
jgi:hypothetical protein